MSLPLIAAAIVAVAPTVAAQGTPPASGTAAPKKDAPKKGDPKKPDAAPAATAAPAAPSATEASAPKPASEPPAPDETKEATRAVYISVDIGFTRADVGGISDSTGFDKTAANGLLAGIGVGYRYKDLRIGGRFRDSNTTEFSLWSVMGEVGYGLPFRPVSPVLFAHAGYMFSNGIERSVIGSALPAGNVLTPRAQLDGLVVGGELVASLWLTKFLRVGPFLGVDTRNNALYNDSGSGVGYLLSIGVRGTGDIGF
jgi:hypothetical protein